MPARSLHKLAVILRKRRFDNGSLRLDKVKLAFHTNAASGLPESCFAYPIKDSNKLVEEFMLLANLCVAERIYRAFPDRALLRQHPKPLERKLEETVRQAKLYHIDLKCATSRELHASLVALAQQVSPEKFQAMQLLCTQPMQVAKYFCTGDQTEAEFLHYALNFKFYTHFTSPIRSAGGVGALACPGSRSHVCVLSRYADLMVHRELAAALAGEPAPDEPDAVSEQAAACNDRKQAAKVAQARASKCDGAPRGGMRND